MTITSSLLLDINCVDADLVRIRELAFEELSDQIPFKRLRKLSRNDLISANYIQQWIQGNNIISRVVSHLAHRKFNFKIPGLEDNTGRYIQLDYVVPENQFLPVSIIEFDLDNINSFTMTVDFTSKDLYFIGTIGASSILLAKTEDNNEVSMASGFKNTFILTINKGITISSYRPLQ